MGVSSSSQYNSTATTTKTPPRTTNASSLDPRSPSQDIERTPIQFNENSGSNSIRAKNENSGSDSSERSSKKEEKPRKLSLRQKMFERKKKEEVNEDKKGE